MTGRIYADDNFGVYKIEDEDDLEFYHWVQSESIWKNCGACNRSVKLRPDYGICNSCAEILEHGGDPYG